MQKNSRSRIGFHSVRFLVLFILWVLGVNLEWAEPWILAVLIVLTYGIASIPYLGKKSSVTKTISVSQNNPESTSERWQQRLELVVEGSYDGIWDWDIQGNRVFWSDRIYQMTDMDRGALGDDFEKVRGLMHPEDRSQFDRNLRAHVKFHAPFQVEIRLKSPQWEQYRWFRVQGKAKLDEEGVPQQMAGSITDIDQQKRHEQALLTQAFEDPTTGLGNRAAFLDALAKAQLRTLEREDAVFALILLDIDKFKAVNDNYGQGIGDKALTALAKLLRAYLPRSVKIFRVGGDEFAFIQPRLRHRGDVTRLTQSLREKLESPIEVDGHSIYVTASMGIVFSNESIHSSDTLQQDAYLALYKAKQRGHGNSEIFQSELRGNYRHSFRLEQDLRHALNREQIFVAYQPIVDLNTLEIVGFEALARWQHPELGIVSPVEFIPIAEESGLIKPIGEWVMREACTRFAEWLPKFPQFKFISINVAAPQVLQEDIPGMAERICRSARLPMSKVKLEFTESVAMKDIGRIQTTIAKLRELGIRVSLDDFGTGYSSLSYLKEFQIQTLKIDRAFVKDIGIETDESRRTGQTNGTIAQTIIGMAHNLNLDIIAEGVENEVQARYLRDQGVQYVQGFLYGRPLLTHEVHGMVKGFKPNPL